MSGRQILVWRSGMKAPCMSKEHYKSIHDVVNHQGFSMHYKAIPKKVSQISGSFPTWENQMNTAKQKDGLTSFLMLRVLEAKIFQYGFPEEH